MPKGVCGFQKGKDNYAWKGGVNAENVKAYNKRWQKENKELCSYYSKQRYYRKRGANAKKYTKIISY